MTGICDAFKDAGVDIDKLKTANIDLSKTSDTVSSSQAIQIINQSNLTKEQKDAITSTLGLESATKKAAASTALWNAALNIGVTILATLLIKAIDTYIHRLDRAKEKLEETTTELESIGSEIDSINHKIDELLSKDKLSVTDENELKRLQEENRQLEIRQKLLEAQKAKDSAKVNRQIEKQYASQFTSSHIYTTNDNGQLIEGQTAEEYLQYNIDKYEKLVAANRELTDAERVWLDNFRANALAKSESLMDLTEGYVAVTDEEKAFIGGINKLLEDISFVMDTEAGTIPDITTRLVDKFATHQLTPMSDLMYTDKEISDWINSLSDDEKKIMLTCDIDDKSLDNLKRYLEENLNKDVPEIELDVKFSRREMIDAINGMSGGFDVLDEIYADIFDKGSFDFTKLDTKKFEEAFSGLETEYSDFIETVSKSPDDVDACQEAFDNLTSAYINHHGILSNVTEENAEVTAAMLKNMGVENAAELVERQLVAAKHAVVCKTAEEVDALVTEGTVSAETAQEIKLLVIEEQAFNQNALDTSASIQNLQNLIKACGLAVEGINWLNRVQALQERWDSGNHSALLETQLAKAKSLAKGQISDLLADYRKLNSVSNGTTSYKGGDKTIDAMEKAAEEAKDAFKEVFDFFERRVKVLDDSLNLLSAHMENVVGSFAKNKLIDAQIGVNAEKINNYTDALAMYTQRANEALAKLPADVAEKIKNGAVSANELTGESGEELKEAIEDYTKWADKVADCKQQLAELKEALRDLELEKFNNIIEDFTAQFDIRDDSIDLIQKQIELFEAAGQMIGESFYTAQIEQSQKQLSILEEEKAKLVEQMSSAVSSGRVEVGTDEWLEMVNALSEVEGSILECKTAIEEFDNALLELHWQVFDRIQEQFSNLDSELSNIRGLFDDFDVSGDNEGWSDQGLAQLGLLAQQYELAQYQVQQYNDAINKLNEDYLAGRYSATEYADKLAELSSSQWDAVNSAESIKDAIIDLNETRINEEIEGIEDEIDAYKELIDAQIKALQAAKDLHDYEASIAEKTKSVSDLERQIAAMQNDNSAATIAKRKKLEEQLAEAKKDLADAEYEHSIQAQEDALNKELESFEKEKNSEIEALKLTLEEREQLIAESFETVKQNAELISQQIAEITTLHGVAVSDAIVDSWASGESAIASYGAMLSESTSQFISELMGVETEIYGMQAEANATADSLAWMFATRADGLVSELLHSQQEEWNMQALTHALHDSLVATLESGYDVSGITGGLKNVESAANSAAAAVRSLVNELQQAGDVSSKSYRIVDGYSGKVVEYGLTREEAEQLWKSKYGGHAGSYQIQAYAKGVRNLNKDQLAWTQEEGGEVILSPTRNSILTPLKSGDTVLTKEQTDNIFEWAKFDPTKFASLKLFDSINTPSMNKIGATENNTSVHIDNVLTVNGNVDDTNIKRMEEIANKAVSSLVTQMGKQIKYRNV